MGKWNAKVLIETTRGWARRVDAMPVDAWIRGHVLDGIGQVEDLAEALEEKEREVERLRWFYENMRDVDRRILQAEYEERDG